MLGTLDGIILGASIGGPIGAIAGAILGNKAGEAAAGIVDKGLGVVYIGGQAVKNIGRKVDNTI